MLRTHTPIHRDECRSLHLPLDGKWFSTEMGGLTAFTLQADAYMVKIYLLTQDMDHATPLNQDTCVPFYGVFKSKDAWNTHRRGLPRAYHEPPYPFTTSSTLEYDRCRCTLMGIKGALYKPPQTNEVTLKEMEEFTSAKRIILPRADCSWTRTKEEALRLGGHVLEWTIDETTVYSVYGNFETCTWRLIHYMETLQEENTCIYRDFINRKINWKHVASCNMYGFLLEDWNSSDSLVSLAKAIAKPEAE